MLFNSLEYLVFFPLVVAIAFAIPERLRQVHLLVASYVFYMAWEPAYALLMLASTVMDYLVALQIPGAGPRGRRAWLALSLTLSLSLLFSFKYYNLVNATFSAGAAWLGLHWPLPESNLLLPVGISFYTFQTIGYVVDVYRGDQEPEPSFVSFALYVSFFPQLVAGPIERASRLLPQLQLAPSVDWDRIASGLRLILWGLFKKVVVADRLSPIVDAIYGNPDHFHGPGVVLGAVAFGYQVFCDFSGYSDVAIGSARVLGVELVDNFDQPHLSRSVREFWSRWHMSLMTWFRDYLYFPLGGSRRGRARTALNVILVFVVSGLWHGAAWSFVFWGLLNAAYLIAERATDGARTRLAEATGWARWVRARAVSQVVLTVGAVWFAHIFFRSPDLGTAFTLIHHLGSGWFDAAEPGGVRFLLRHLRMEWPAFLLAFALIPITEALEVVQRNRHRWPLPPLAARWGFDYALIFGILALGYFSKERFVYFQF